ncbi:hypothetical protein ABDK09_22875 [Vibrio sp. CDRSL-10 TSBA]
MNKSLLAMTVASLLPYAPVSLAQDTTADETVVVTANRVEQTQSSVSRISEYYHPQRYRSHASG